MYLLFISSLYYGRINPMTGLLHLKLGKILIYQDEDKLALHHLTEAYQILKITHGVNSRLFRDELLPLLQQVKSTE